jgi:hypothetical protein
MSLSIARARCVGCESGVGCPPPFLSPAEHVDYLGTLKLFLCIHQFLPLPRHMDPLGAREE